MKTSGLAAGTAQPTASATGPFTTGPRRMGLQDPITMEVMSKPGSERSRVTMLPGASAGEWFGVSGRAICDHSRLSCWRISERSDWGLVEVADRTQKDGIRKGKHFAPTELRFEWRVIIRTRQTWDTYITSNSQHGGCHGYTILQDLHLVRESNPRQGPYLHMS